MNLHDVLPIAREAGRRILPHFKASPNVTYKADESPVTDADLEAHEYLCGELKRLAPAVAIVSEEGVGAPLPEEAPFWLVDPLDGTRDFLAGSPDFTVNIALIEGGIARLGVVYVPVADMTYFASEGGGAFKRAAEADAVQIRTRAADPKALVAFASRHHGGLSENKVRALWPSAEIRVVGSALKLCRIAEGAGDFYFRETPCMGWDTAGPQRILEEAGGLLLDLSGRPLSYRRSTLTNPPFVAMGDPAFGWRRYLRK